jgi:hypothetical protein
LSLFSVPYPEDLLRCRCIAVLAPDPYLELIILTVLKSFFKASTLLSCFFLLVILVLRYHSFTEVSPFINCKGGSGSANNYLNPLAENGWIRPD